MNDDAGRLDRIMVWKLIRDFFGITKRLIEEADNLAKQRSGANGDGKAAPPAPKGGAPARVAPAKGPPPVYVGKRQLVREALEGLRPALEERYGTRQAYSMAIAFTAYVDEHERTALGDLATEWTLPTLQEELVQIDDGGDRFFDEIDKLVLQRDTYPTVYEAFLLCLRAGFVGRCKGKPELVTEYVRSLEAAIRRAEGADASAAPTPVTLPPAAARTAVTFTAFPVRTYLVALGAVLLVAIVLRVSGLYTVAASSVGMSCSAGSL